MQTLYRFYAYANMKHDQDTGNAENQVLLQKARAAETRIAEKFSFLEPEILAIPEERLEVFRAAEPGLKKYDVTIREIEKTRQCLACQKPRIMGCDDVKTDWVCWVDADGLFVGNCSEWLSGDDVDEMRIKRCNPPPPDFTPETLATWQR